MRPIMVILVSVLPWLGLVLPSSAEACSCLPPTIPSSWFRSEQAIRGVVMGERIRPNSVQYRMRVRQDFHGCLQPGDEVIVTTPVSGATCGTRLPVGHEMIVFGSGTGNRIQTSSCAGNRDVRTLARWEWRYLQDRPLDCLGGPKCADGDPAFTCAIDPCVVTPACGPDVECFANYCVGCVAEFYDVFDDTAQCLPW